MEGFFKEILDDLPSGVWVTDSEDRVIYINKAMTGIAGASRNQFTGLYVFKDLNKPGNKEFLDCYRKVKENLFPGEYEVRLKDSKGKGFVHRGWLTPLIDNGMYNGMIVTAEDITEKDIFEKAMKNSEERFRRLIEFGADGIVLGSHEGIVTEANQAACDILGMNRSILIGKHISSIPFTKESLKSAPLRFDLLQKGETVVSERTLILPDGTEIETEMKTKMMCDGTYQAIFRDITEKKNSEKQISEFSRSLEHKVNERTSQLESVNKELESFSYSVSHDLRAPVRHILGFTDILKKSLGTESDPATTSVFSKISAAACKMERLIDDLLKFSKTGRVELSKNKTDMISIIESVKKELCECISDRKIEWNISKLPPVHCDKNLIKIVWENLISNSCKYTSGKDALIEIGVSEKDFEYEFFIKDNGIGFDPEFSHKLFGVFQRLHLEKDFPGTGVGLATARRIISRHGGAVRGESEGEGKGACFYFTLPKN